jgi:hypothetical protein
MGLQAKIIGRKNGVGMSADAAGKSACATGLQRQVGQRQVGQRQVGQRQVGLKQV